MSSNNKIIVLLFGILLITGINTSCKKFLDAKPDKQLVVPSTVADLQAMLDFTQRMSEITPCWDEASADNYILQTSAYNNLSLREKQGYTWQVKDYLNYPNDWSFLYDQVNVTNTVLDNLSKVERNSQNQNDWDNVKGSALVFRAQAFLRAAFIFAKAYDAATASQDLGIVLRLTSDFNQLSQRTTVQQTYDRIISDLKSSLLLLPTLPINVLRPSKSAAFGLLARTYLSMRQYADCFKYADSCLQLKNQLMDYNTLTAITGLTPFTQFNVEDIFHSRISIYTFLNVSPTTERVDSALYDSYDNNDLRKTAFFYPLNPGHIFKGTYVGTLGSLYTGIAVDEVLLMRAECNARLGNRDAALADINALMQKRWKTGLFTPFTASTDADALTIILRERRKELIFRCTRWMDIKRLNKDGANIILTRNLNGTVYTLPSNDNRYALPLPADIISITGMPQNPQ